MRSAARFVTGTLFVIAMFFVIIVPKFEEAIVPGIVAIISFLWHRKLMKKPPVVEPVGCSCRTVRRGEIILPQHSAPVVDAEALARNLDALLAVVYRQFVALRDEDFNVYYEVFCEVFAVLQENMKAVDSYYSQYSSRKQFVGSHADQLRIGRPDEFDLDIVIRMPLSFAEAPYADESDLTIEPHVPGHVLVRGGRQYDALPYRENWKINQTAYKWFDNDGYLLRTKFTDWFKSVVVRALNRMPIGKEGFPTVMVKDVVYYLKTRDSGPAYTLSVHRDDGFRLDVDLVPVFKFPEERWPPGSEYRDIPWNCMTGDWLLVPKAARGDNRTEASRSWRVALHAQEQRLVYNCQRLRQAIRLVKKFRDAQEMNGIASYYIKTLFLWEAENTEDPEFWHQSESSLFKVMVQRLYEALRDRRIPFYWNERNNLIGHLHPQLLRVYELKTKKLLELLEQPRFDPDKVVKFLLTPFEYRVYLNLS